jgi:hypothetical protein
MSARDLAFSSLPFNSRRFRLKRSDRMSQNGNATSPDEGIPRESSLMELRLSASFTFAHLTLGTECQKRLGIEVSRMD